MRGPTLGSWTAYGECVSWRRHAMMQSPDRYCGNCGNPRSPGDTMCARCGAPLSVTAFHLEAPTHTGSKTTLPIWQTTSPANPGPSPVPNPPRSRWTTRLLIGQSVLVVGLLAIIIVLLVHPLTGNSSQQQGYLPTIPATHSPTLSPTPPYEANLSSTNPNLFVNAFADALQEQDVASIAPHTDTLHFVIICDSRNGLPGTCDTSWSDLQNQLVSDKVRISLPPDATLNQPPPLASLCPNIGDTSGYLNFFVVGSFDQTTGTLPLAHFGTAVLGFACVSCGSETTWGWRALFLC